MVESIPPSYAMFIYIAAVRLINQFKLPNNPSNFRPPWTDRPHQGASSLPPSVALPGRSRSAGCIIQTGRHHC